VLGKNWRQAVLLTAGRLGFGYGCLAALATGAEPQPSLVLLAGPPAYLLYRHRYGRPVPRRATPGESDSTA
jgi:hypothetical protein